MTTTLLFPRAEMPRADIAALIASQGLAVVNDSAWTNGIAFTSWSDERGAITYMTDASSGIGFFVLRDLGGLAEALTARLPCAPAATVLAEARAARDVVTRLRTTFGLRPFLVIDAEGSREALEILFEHLLDDEDLVRWAAASILRDAVGRDVEAAFAAAAQRHPDLVEAHAAMRTACEHAEQGILNDTPTTDWNELMRRAREGAAAGQWQRVVRAADVLLAKRSDPIEVLYLRALAHAAAGEPVLACALLGAAGAIAKAEARASARAGDDDDLDDDDLHDEPAAAASASPSPLHHQIQVRLAELAPSLAAIEDAAARSAATDAVRAWLRRWASEQRSTALAGAAGAIAGALPELDPVLRFLVAWDPRDLAGLEEAARLVPDSAVCALELGRALASRDGAAARRWLSSARAMLRNATGTSPAAVLIAELHGAVASPVDEAEVVEALANLAYKAKEWDEAGRLGDELVALDPDSAIGWQIRANARTFALRHEEAVDAYSEALIQLDRLQAPGSEVVFLGTDPRPGMRFNRACVLAKLGRRDEALDDLRLAVRDQAHYGDDAAGDDYFAALWDDPEFRAIVSADPRALITAAEKTPAAVQALVERARKLTCRGELADALADAERAAGIAEHTGQAALHVEALHAAGLIHRAGGTPGPGLDLVARALALAEETGVSAAVLADVVYTHATLLHATEQWARAATEYGRALELARAAGDNALVLARFYYDRAHLSDDHEAVRELAGAGAAILERFLATTPPGDAWAHASLDLAQIEVELGHSHASTGEAGAALALAARAVGRIERAADLAWTASSSLLDDAIYLVDRIEEPLGAAGRDAARDLHARLDRVRFPGPPAVQAEHGFWHRVRQFVAGVREVGAGDRRIAEILRLALRNDESVPDLPFFADLRRGLAERVTRYPSLLAMTAIAIDTAEHGGSIDRAIDDLEGLCLASLEDGDADDP